MEQPPHLLVELLYDPRVRAESVSWLHLPARRIWSKRLQYLRRVIAEATEAGLLGKNIMGTVRSLNCLSTPGQGVTSVVKKRRAD